MEHAKAAFWGGFCIYNVTAALSLGSAHGNVHTLPYSALALYGKRWLSCVTDQAAAVSSAQVLAWNVGHAQACSKRAKSGRTPAQGLR
jgi:hypothetical protein